MVPVLTSVPLDTVRLAMAPPQQLIWVRLIVPALVKPLLTVRVAAVPESVCTVSVAPAVLAKAPLKSELVTFWPMVVVPLLVKFPPMLLPEALRTPDDVTARSDRLKLELTRLSVPASLTATAPEAVILVRVSVSELGMVSPAFNVRVAGPW